MCLCVWVGGWLVGWVGVGVCMCLCVCVCVPSPCLTHYNRCAQVGLDYSTTFDLKAQRTLLPPLTSSKVCMPEPRERVNMSV